MLHVTVRILVFKDSHLCKNHMTASWVKFKHFGYSLTFPCPGAIEKQKLVYILNRDAAARLTISSPLEAHKANTLVYHVVGVDVGFENPMFACLEMDYEVRSWKLWLNLENKTGLCSRCDEFFVSLLWLSLEKDQTPLISEPLSTKYG